MPSIARLLAPASLSLALLLSPLAAIAAQTRRTAPPPAAPPSTANAASRTAGQSARAPADSAGDRMATLAAGLRLRGIGPSLLSGRVSDIAVHPTNKRLWYVATASGGLWKTTNAGTTWAPVFDNEGSYSIGAVVLDPKNPNVVWVGTGEHNAQRSVSYGDGVYKSIDGGRSWHNVGLKSSEHIARILIDPRNSDIVYVASQGPLYNKGGDRGLFKTVDGGKTWTKVLDGGTWAGVADAAMDPRNPDVLLASTWQRARRQWGYIAGGPESALWRSTDGGATWVKSQRGLPGGELGRIGLAISPVKPDIVYAILEAAADSGGFYRSRDNGVNWQRMSGYQSGGLYYNDIFPDPVDADRVYSMDTYTMVTEDGGRTFRRVGEKDKHVDNHVVWIDPADVDHLLIGCDGGLYESFDRGQTYTYFANLPLGQFYRIDLDNSLPFYRVYGGTQDNASIGGPSRTRTENGITNRDWFFTAGGDGFQSRVDPEDPNTVYAQSQHGNLSRFNLATGEEINIVPQADRGEPGLRWHWDSPLIISPFSHTRLYFASDRLWRSDDRGNGWRAVSPDLSRQIDRNRLKLMDRVWSVDAVAKNTSTSLYGTIVALAESPKKEGLLWVGTDDGLIQVSEDAGATWRRIDHVSGVPDTTFVSRVTPSAFDVNTVYASFDNHKAGDYKPYVVKSTDLGRTWTSIAGNLPERGTVYVVIEDHKDPKLLFAGTEFGLYFTADGGKQWTRLRGGLPTIQVRDLAIQKREDDLVVATFGRGIYILDDIAPLRALTPSLVASAAALLPVRSAPLYVESNPLAGPGVGWQGADFYAAPNPPFGATFTYYLKSALQTRRARRQAADRASAKEGRDVFYPSWDSLKVEDREEAPAVLLTVSDAEGHVVRRLTAPTSAGLHRVAWDLRYPAPNPPTNAPRGGSEEDDSFDRPPIGPIVVAGTYTVAMHTRVDGVMTPVGEPRSFEVVPLDRSVPPHAPAVLAFQQKTARLQRAVLGANAAATETASRLQLLGRAIREAPGANDQMFADLRALETRLRDIQEALNGDRTAARRSESFPPSLSSRLGGITRGLWGSTLEDATTTQKHQYDLVAADFGAVLERLRTLVDVDLKQLEDRAEAAGAPWTSGRLPSWRP